MVFSLPVIVPEAVDISTKEKPAAITAGFSDFLT